MGYIICNYHVIKIQKSVNKHCFKPFATKNNSKIKKEEVLRSSSALYIVCLYVYHTKCCYFG